MDLINEILSKIRMLDVAIRELGTRGKAYAQLEMDYRIALADKTLSEREKGTPVTIISDVCRGDRKIARMRFDRDCAEVVYKSAQEAINATKLQIKILDAQLEREWGHASGD